MILVKLVFYVILFMFCVACITGAFRFWKDVRNFKSDLEFSGSRKDLIDYLVDQQLKEKEQKEGESSDS